MRKYILNYLILLVLLSIRTYSQEFVPPIQNYSPADYSAASQNWDIALDERGVVYTANNQGLLVYDGLSWELFPLESQSIIRSVYPYNGKIFTGSYKEFGYWENQEDGSMQYTSLASSMAEFDMQSDEFWEIMEYNGTIIFRSFGAVYKFENNSISKIQDIVSTAMGVFQNKLIMAPRKSGLVYLDNGRLEDLKGNQSVIDGVNIIDMDAIGDTLFIAAKEALYVYSDNNFSKFPDEKLNKLLEKSELNHIISISDKEIILGTIKNGIIKYTMVNSQIQVYNRSSGLQNNTVLGMTYDRGRLWLALDKGVDMIDLKAPITFYTDNTGELGAVYDIQKYDDKYYLASNTGIYSFSDNNLNLVDNTEDHTWNLSVIDDVLYANHNTGIYKIVNDEFIPIQSRTGSFNIQKTAEANNDLLVANYTGISLYNKLDNTVTEIDSINFPVKSMILEDEATIWAAHPYEGIYKIVHEDFRTVKIEKIPALGGKANFNPKIYELNKQIVAYVNEKWFKYNPFNNQFENFKELENYRNERLIFEGEQKYVFTNSEKGFIRITDLNGNELMISSESLQNRLVRANENFIMENDSTYYITLNDGFAKLNLNQLISENTDQWISKPFLKEFSDGSRRYSLLENSTVPYKDSRSLIFRAGMPISKATNLRYILEGEETLSGSFNNGSVDFRNLAHGDYKLQLSAAGINDEREVSENFFFSIAPPWYFSIWMKLIYLLTFLSLIFSIYWLNKQKLKKHQFKLEEKFEKEHSDRLNRIEKEKLMNEIDIKRKELANTTMMAAKKNEVLMEIQNELNKDKNKFSNQFRLKHIMNKINKAVKNKDEWKVFETNFNEVHEDFFKDVLQKFPKLTSKDLKLCSYLKMNLSSKEIAPLMGISVRGVEVHRYRLRKKMNLDSDVNLTKFLIKNF